MIRRIMRSRWLGSALVVLVAMALVWVFGPLLGFGETHPLETELARYIAIAVLFVLWLVANLVRELRAGRRDKALAAAIVEVPPEVKEAEARSKATQQASAEEVALLSGRLRDAIQALRKSRPGGARRRLSAMPWYVIIGPPGAGKTTALLNCGLRFPLDNGKPIQGVGGTRNCEWMFADEAVLIDTAGRYTTQDSEEAVDGAAWLGFLALLKKYRRRQPLNGALIAIGLSDLVTLTEADRRAHARAIRQRVREMHERLGLRLPIYVLFTKADLIAGFSEFFDNLGREEREQVWGMTFPVDNGTDEEGAVAAFRGEFDLLVTRLNNRLLERIHQEPDLRRRRLIYGFSQQVASLRDIAGEFLTEAFRPSRLEARPLLRGVYLTSGTQFGTPFDRLLGTMSAEFGLPRQTGAVSAGPGRSYFLTRLLRDVVFGEAALAGLDPAVERRTKWLSIGAYAGCALFLLVLGGGWLASYIDNVALITEVRANAASYNSQLAELQRRGAADQELAATLPLLDTLRNLRGEDIDREGFLPLLTSFGLSQGGGLALAAHDAYLTGLNRILLPRLLTRVEAKLAGGMNDVDTLYQTLKVYLVLCRQGPLETEPVEQWATADLFAAYPDADHAPVRAAMLTHVKALLAQPLQPLPPGMINTALIAQARAVLNKEPLAEYSYHRMLRSKSARNLPDWTVAEFGGPESGRVFQLRSGKPLDSGIPGIYTWSGYHNKFVDLLTNTAQDIVEDGWVLGHAKLDLQASLREGKRLLRDVSSLYFDDYARRWDAMLADVEIKPYGDFEQALDLLNRLSGPASPLRDLMLAMDAQMQLSRPDTPPDGKSLAVGKALGNRVAQDARLFLTIRQNEYISIMAQAYGNDADGKPIDPARRVDEHFRALHDFVTPTERKPVTGLEETLKTLLAMYQSFNQASLAPGPGQGKALTDQLYGTGNGPATTLQAQTALMPPPVAKMLAPLASNATQIAANGVNQEISNAWNTDVLPFCEAAFHRYPFIKDSKDDVPNDDFKGLLGPGGKIEAFFTQYLKRYVDTTQTPWKWQSAGNGPPGVSPASLLEFQKAAQIRDGLFNQGSTIQVRFSLKPVSLDPSIGQISVEIAGQTLTYDHGVDETKPFIWPSADGKTLVRVTMTPISGGNAALTEQDGPWALLRLLDGHIIPSGQPDKFAVTFTGAGGEAKFELSASSVRNPFTLAALRSFRCPPKL